MSNASDASKRVRREQAREHARVMREKEQKKQKRNRIFIQGGVVVGLLAVATIVTLVIVSVNQPAGPGPQNMASDGILLEGDGTNITAVATDGVEAGAEPVATDQSTMTDTDNIVMYVDYQCPYCAQFEAANAEQIATWVASGSATLEIHPIAFLDSASLGNKYSSRAANAAACVADYEPDSFLAVNTAFFNGQPEENTEGLSDDNIKAMVTSAGVTNEDVMSCISDNTYASWVKAETTRVTGGVIPNSDTEEFAGTPMVIVNGSYYAPTDLTSATEFASFVQSVSQVPAAE